MSDALPLQRDAIRVRLDCGCDQGTECLGCHRCAAEGGDQALVLVGIEDVHITDRRLRSIGEGGEQHQEARHHRRRGVRIEDVRGITQFAPERAVDLFIDVQCQIEVSGPVFEVQGPDGEFGELKRGRPVAGGHRVGLHAEGHLEHRREGLRPRHVELVHQAFERYVCVRVGGEVGGAHLIDEIVEAGRGIDDRPERHGVDEHADQVVEQRVRTPRYRRSDDDVGGAAQA